MNSEAMRSIEVAAGAVWPAACPAAMSENIAATRDGTAIRRASRVVMSTSGRNARHAMGLGAAIESRRTFRRNNETDSRRSGAVRLSGPRDESGRPGRVRPPPSRRPRAAGARAELPHRVVQGRAGVRHGEGDDRRDRDDHVPGSPRSARDALSRRGGPRRDEGRARRTAAEVLDGHGQLQARRGSRSSGRDRRVGDRRDRVLGEAPNRHVLLPEEPESSCRRPGTTARAGSTAAGFRSTTTRTTASRSSSS